ncbi:cytochrome oxidase putative small subunit CydP [Pseudomonas lopnurensis]|uniref:cytochrome oxidase putative small subunit CydP n=1 Tax=Pseudomonas lopnurensis TaxID=1477517 RepID=UPI0028AF8A35|nr:cytochrome oxidase putative small subunit CydP [Pseudomonas lopnurensis]
MFKPSLRRDVVLILLVKVTILMTIKSIWFDAPSIPENGSARVAEYLLDSRGSIPEGGPR